MANAIVVKPARRSRRVTARTFKVTLSGNYVQAVPATPAGEILNLTGATDPNFLDDGVGGLYDAGAHAAGLFETRVTRFAGGYPAELVRNTHAGATWANAYILKIFSVAGTELAAAAYPAGITGDTYEIEVAGPNGSF
jgi:hypothetical protein